MKPRSIRERILAAGNDKQIEAILSEGSMNKPLVKLYNVPRNSRIKLGDFVLHFDHIDGMYSLCYDEATGNPVHLAAWTEVEVEGPWDGGKDE